MRQVRHIPDTDASDDSAFQLVELTELVCVPSSGASAKPLSENALSYEGCEKENLGATSHTVSVPVFKTLGQGRVRNRTGLRQSEFCLSHNPLGTVR